ncbi:MAG: hypothetical protein ACFFB0_04440 [Promethearchaeota archaeon]
MGGKYTLKIKMIEYIIGMLSLHIEKNQTAICDILDMIWKSEKGKKLKYLSLVMSNLEIFDKCNISIYDKSLEFF